MEEVFAGAGDVRSIAQPIDQAIVVGPFVPVIGQEFARVQAVGFDYHGFMEMVGVGQNARRGHEPTDKRPLEIHDVENMIFDLAGVGGDGPLDLREGPSVNVEGAVQDDISAKNFAQGFAQVSECNQDADCVAWLGGGTQLRLEVTQLVERPDARQARLDEAGVSDAFARRGQGTHRFHSGNIERSQ
jgi:hypothetical protein